MKYENNNYVTIYSIKIVQWADNNYTIISFLLSSLRVSLGDFSPLKIHIITILYIIVPIVVIILRICLSHAILTLQKKTR